MNSVPTRDKVSCPFENNIENFTVYFLVYRFEKEFLFPFYNNKFHYFYGYRHLLDRVSEFLFVSSSASACARIYIKVSYIYKIFILFTELLDVCTSATFFKMVYGL